MEIERLKQEITNSVMEDILKKMTPAKKIGQKKPVEKTTVFSAFDDEEKDTVKTDDIKLNRKLMKASTERGVIKRGFPKRLSKGDLSKVRFKPIGPLVKRLNTKEDSVIEENETNNEDNEKENNENKANENNESNNKENNNEMKVEGEN